MYPKCNFRRKMHILDTGVDVWVIFQKKVETKGGKSAIIGQAGIKIDKPGKKY